jgi:predicted SAM-dependent methyltransferase
LYSFLGRIFKKRKSRIPLDKHPILVDLGAGANYTEGWVHVDFYRFHLKFWRKRIDTQKPEVEMDLRYPISCPANAVDGVYSCHALEHLYPEDAISLLKEIYRILKPSCYLRLIVPDLEIAVNFYIGRNKDLNYEFGAEAIGYLTQNCGHRSVWDAQFLSHLLDEIGFVDIKKVRFGEEGADQRLIKDNMVRKHESLVIEARKPSS